SITLDRQQEERYGRALTFSGRHTRRVRYNTTNQYMLLHIHTHSGTSENDQFATPGAEVDLPDAHVGRHGHHAQGRVQPVGAAERPVRGAAVVVHLPEFRACVGGVGRGDALLRGPEGHHTVARVGVEVGVLVAVGSLEPGRRDGG